MAQPYYVLKQRPAPGLLSVVVPIYNEEEVILRLIERLEQVLAAAGCEITTGRYGATWRRRSLGWRCRRHSRGSGSRGWQELSMRRWRCWCLRPS